MILICQVFSEAKFTDNCEKGILMCKKLKEYQGLQGKELLKLEDGHDRHLS